MSPRNQSAKQPILTTALGMALCIAITVGLLCLYFWTERRHAAVLLFAILIPTVWAFPFYVCIRGLIATRHFSKSELVMDTHRPGLGQSVRVRLTLAARRTIKLDGCKLVLRAVEEARTGRHKMKTVEAARVAVSVPTPARLERNTPHVFEGEITVPADGMESFEGHGASLQWILEAYALLPKVSVLLDHQELIVRPVSSVETASVPTETSAGDRLRLTLKPGSLQVGSRGRIEVTVADDLTNSVESLAVCVSRQTCITDGEPTEEHSIFAKTVIDLKPGRPIAFDFLIPPAGPMSFAGKLFDIVWTVRATLYSHDGAAIEATEFPVTVGPRPA